MQKTLFIIMGAFFSVLFLALVVKVVFDKTGDFESTGRFVVIQPSVQGSTLRIAWETQIPTNAALHYTLNGNNFTVVDDKFEKTHSLEVPGLSSTVNYYIEACDISGYCFNSELMNSTFT